MATLAEEPLSTTSTLPPGPRPLPVLGNLLGLRRNPLAYIQRLQQTYGDMATLHIGRAPVVMLFRPEYVRYVLIENPRKFTNREITQPDDGFVSEGLLTLDGDKHRQQRRAVQPAFHKKRVESYAAVIEQYTQELLQTWQPGDTVDISSSMQELTVRIVGKCLFDLDLANQLDNLGSTFNDMIGSQPGILEALFNLRIDNPLTTYGKRTSALRRLDMLIYTLLAERRADPRDRGDVLSMLFEAQTGDAETPSLSDKQIHDHVVTFIAAGHETTANNLIWTFYLLAEHPQIREKLLQELQTVLNGQAPTVEDLAKLTYTDWVLQESLRLYPPAWIQGRFSREEIELGGRKIPAGTTLMMSQWIMHRLPEIWGEDADVFRPERWNPENGQQIPSGAYFPFGAGPRICIGMPFAQLEAKLILITTLQRFTPQNLPGYRAEVNPLITLRPKEHLRMQLMPTAGDEQSWKGFRASNTVAENAEKQGCLTLLLDLIGPLRL